LKWDLFDGSRKVGGRSATIIIQAQSSPESIEFSALGEISSPLQLFSFERHGFIAAVILLTAYTEGSLRAGPSTFEAVSLISSAKQFVDRRNSE